MRCQTSPKCVLDQWETLQGDFMEEGSKMKESVLDTRFLSEGLRRGRYLKVCHVRWADRRAELRSVRGGVQESRTSQPMHSRMYEPSCGELITCSRWALQAEESRCGRAANSHGSKSIGILVSGAGLGLGAH